MTCGACTAHAQICSGGSGIFLHVTECRIILTSNVKRGASLPAPYVNEYGETDEGMRRGNPLRLDPARWAELNQMWMTNDIPDKISRQFDPDYRDLARWWEF